MMLTTVLLVLGAFAQSPTPVRYDVAFAPGSTPARYDGSLAAGLEPARYDASLAAGPPPVRYDVAFPNAVHHEAEISVTLADLPPGIVEFRMSRSSPGRYALHEFAKNVYSVRAVDGAGRELPITRPDPYQWDVAGHDGTVMFTYTLFADRAGGTYSQFDETHAHMNMPATFMWARGQGWRPVEVRFHAPEGSGWRAATQLHRTEDPWVFEAPNLQYFFDSPTELSDYDLREWTIQGISGPLRMQLAIHHLGTDAEVDAYAEWVRAVVAEEIAVYGEPPEFDGGSYTFIADYLPWASGDGMEHRNSTILSSTGSLARSAGGLIGTVSHEFFHAWNVERIRPRMLEPFDFERANMSRELWFAEGFTSYYTQLFLTRAGIIEPEQYARGLGGGLDFVINSSARTFAGPVEMAMQAPFVDAATAVDPSNRLNTFISYYTYGSVLGLGLDLTLRSRLGTSLDDFMRHMWHVHGKTEIPYTVEDIERELGVFTGDRVFAEQFFADYVYASGLPDYESLLSHAGLLLRRRSPDGAFLGQVQLREGDDGMELVAGTQIGTALYDAGIDRGDVILSIDGAPVRSSAEWRAVQDAHAPGAEVEIVFATRGRTKTRQVRFAADPRLEVVTYESAGLDVTDAMLSFRDAWTAARR